MKILFAGSRHVNGLDDARQLFPTLGPGQLAEIRDSIARLAPAVAQRQKFEADERARDAERARPQADWEREQSEQLVAAANERARYRATPGGQAERQIELLEQILDALAKRGRL